MVRPSRRSRRSLLQRFLISDPVLFRVVQRVDHLGNELVGLGDLEHGSCVLVSAAVVSGRENSEQLARSEPLDSVHHALVSPQNELHLIVVKELLHSVRSELHNVSRSIWISDKVRLDSKFGVAVSGVAPQNVHHQLLLRSRHLVDNLQWSLNEFNLIKRDKGGADASMETDDLFFDDCAERQPVEQVVDLIEHGVRLGRVFPQSVAALLGEPERIVDPLVFVVSSEKMDLLGVLDLQSHQEADRLQGVASSVNVVTKE